MSMSLDQRTCAVHHMGCYPRQLLHSQDCMQYMGHPAHHGLPCPHCPPSQVLPTQPLSSCDSQARLGYCRYVLRTTQSCSGMAVQSDTSADTVLLTAVVAVSLEAAQGPSSVWMWTFCYPQSRLKRRCRHWMPYWREANRQAIPERSCTPIFIMAGCGSAVGRLYVCMLVSFQTCQHQQLTDSWYTAALRRISWLHCTADSNLDTNSRVTLPGQEYCRR